MGVSDYVISGADGSARTMTIASKTGTATGNATQGVNDLHIAYVDTVSQDVLLVTDETSNKTVASGDSITFPSITYNAPQPS